jgi:hypothetical protein
MVATGRASRVLLSLHQPGFPPKNRSPQIYPDMSKYTAFRCPEDLLELAKIKAKRDRRSLSNYIITLIERDVQDLIVEGEPQGINGEEERVPNGTAKKRR